MATSQVPPIQSAVIAVNFPLEESKGHQSSCLAVNVVDGVTRPGVAIGSDLHSSSSQTQASVLGWEKGNIATFSCTRLPPLGPEPSTSQSISRTGS